MKMIFPLNEKSQQNISLIFRKKNHQKIFSPLLDNLLFRVNKKQTVLSLSLSRWTFRFKEHHHQPSPSKNTM
jgi:hypothetical protein